MGSFSLDDRYSALTHLYDEILTNSVHPPDEIVKSTRGKISTDDASSELPDEDDLDFTLHNESILPAEKALHITSVMKISQH